MQCNAFEILIQGMLQSSSLWQYGQDTRPHREKTNVKKITDETGETKKKVLATCQSFDIQTFSEFKTMKEELCVPHVL